MRVLEWVYLRNIQHEVNWVCLFGQHNISGYHHGAILMLRAVSAMRVFRRDLVDHGIGVLHTHAIGAAVLLDQRHHLVVVLLLGPVALELEHHLRAHLKIQMSKNSLKQHHNNNIIPAAK